ncbi:hypothetical protein PENSUB_5163 [Penicillium subrubescens]|uniref:Protein kinase domain-containing protein n=1 Tax=Penicillium subrubescens TaxID=1316194 RepID=A0A1Q5UAI0_9EURO|nr:hypothetical protein PENSUB_5163 [Penicillium subrubescens]
MVVTQVEKLEPLPLRKEWMNDLAEAVAFLESLNLAHGDLRPENILLDRNRLKLSDFDCTAQIGTNYEACMAPYGRILNSNETDQGECGTFGFLSPRTEQFALGSLFYFINYGFEVYGNRCLTEDPYEHGPKVVDLLQNMEFPKLDGNPLIDNIIDKCWHNKYVTVSQLAAHTKTLLNERTDAAGSNGEGYREEGNREEGNREEGNREEGNREEGNREEGNREEGNREEGNREEGNREEGNREEGNREEGNREEGNREEGSNGVTTPIESSSLVWWRVVMGRVIHGLWYGLGNSWTSVLRSTNGEVTITERAKDDNSDDVDKNLGEEFLYKKGVCIDLERRGLLRLLCSGEPEQIGFTFDWYRHSL